ncbi:semialdehyde dehydrogenase [Deinococcus sp. KSM4-11]|uniref:semialdehyde dehydrogenase n=1 Tax=Deinococcus sp. KSM4-11 TaxID=2568654 RepID=UPI0010A4EB5E|nr:semialdehyde dehydrogenase [Deinococcus sp. KSM4-11]THF88100.1 semialdehyde dehydrogenase [Deinococcus sp. KSM4-11]
MNIDSEAVPTYRPRHPVAYLTHPGAEGVGVVGRVTGPLAWLPGARLTRRLSLPPVTTDTLRSEDNPERPAGWIIAVPVTPAELKAGTPRARQAIGRAIGQAQKLGAQTVGLGGLTALATARGLALRGVDEIGLTTGDAFAAALVFQSVVRLLAHCPATTRVAIVGAACGIGRCVTALLARRTEQPLLLISRHAGALREMQQHLGHGRTDVSTDLGGVPSCGLVVLLSRAAADLRAGHLGRNAVVLDETRPRVTRPTLLLDRPDVQVVDGGLCCARGIRRHAGAHAGHERLPMALAEALLLGLAGHTGHYTLGEPTVEQAEAMLHLSARFTPLGFTPEAPHSFGERISLNGRFERHQEQRAEAPRQRWPVTGVAGVA